MTATPKPNRPPQQPLRIPLTVVWQVCPCCGEGRGVHLLAGRRAWLVTAAGKVVDA